MTRFGFPRTLPLRAMLLALLALQAQGRASIVGGRLATAGEIPWQAILLFSPAEGDFCGGAVIGPTWVVTAMHCVVGPNTQVSFTVKAGMLDKNDSKAVTRTSKRVLLQPDGPLNDIALVELDKPLDFGPTVQAIPYATSAEVKAGLLNPGILGKASGWGDTTGKQINPPDFLRVVDLPIVSLEVANKPESWNGLLKESSIPAGYEQGGKDVCYGDSGGPLAVPDGRGGWLLVGVVSGNTKGCAAAKSYTAFSSASFYADWIQKTTGIAGGLKSAALGDLPPVHSDLRVTVEDGGLILALGNPRFLEITAQGVDGRTHILSHRRFFAGGRHRLETGSLARGVYILGTGRSRPGQRIVLTR